MEVGVWTFKGEAWARDQHIGEIERPEIRRAPGRRERLQRVGVGNEEQLTRGLRRNQGSSVRSREGRPGRQ